MNKKQREFWERYLWSVRKYGLRGVENCYDKPSSAKKSAYRDIVNANPGARFMTVVSVGRQTFSVGWLFKEKDDWYFRYETVCKSYCVQLDDGDLEEAEAHGVKPWKK